jgi:hypothetical protein
VQQSGHQGAQALVGDAGCREQGLAQGAGQGHDPRTAEAQRRGPPPVRVRVRVRDPLEGWAREDGALAGTFSFQYAVVAGTCPGPEFVEVVQPGIAAQVAGCVDDGLDPHRAAVLEVLLDPRVLAEQVGTTPPVSGPIAGRSMAVRNTPGVSRQMRRPKMISTLAGRPMSRLSAIRASKKARARRGASNTRVRETSTWRMEISHQYPARWSSGPKGSGRRESHRWANTSMVPGCRRLQISCKAAGWSQAAKPLDSSVNEIPARSACRLAHSWPLSQILAG